MLPKREKAVTLEDVYEVSVAFKLLHLCFMSSQMKHQQLNMLLYQTCKAWKIVWIKTSDKHLHIAVCKV